MDIKFSHSIITLKVFSLLTIIALVEPKDIRSTFYRCKTQTEDLKAHELNTLQNFVTIRPETKPSSGFLLALRRGNK